MFCISVGSLAVTCSAFGCCMWSAVNCILREICVRVQCLVGQWIHFLHQYGTLLDEFCTHFYGEMDSNPVASSPFSRRMEKCAQQMPQYPVLLAMRTWKSGQYFFELHVAGSFDDGADFFVHLCQTHVPGSAGTREVSPGWSGTRCTINRSDLWTYTSCSVNS